MIEQNIMRPSYLQRSQGSVSCLDRGIPFAASLDGKTIPLRQSHIFVADSAHGDDVRSNEVQCVQSVVDAVEGGFIGTRAVNDDVGSVSRRGRPG